MKEHPNAQRFREMFEAMNRGDTQAMKAGLADNVTWHTIGSDKPITGKQEVLASFGATDEADFDIEGELDAVVADDDLTVALVNAHATKNGDKLDYRTAEIMRFEGGQVVERWSYSDDTERIREFFGS